MEFEPLGLAAEPFQVRGLLLRVQELVRGHWGLVQEKKLQPQGSANPLQVAVYLISAFLLVASLDSTAQASPACGEWLNGLSHSLFRRIEHSFADDAVLGEFPLLF